MENLLQFVAFNQKELLDQIFEHVGLTFTSLILSLVIGIPVGIFLTRYKKLSGFVIGIISVIQTIPSLALFGFLLPFFGIGAKPAIIALFLYALLPIVRNTYAGIENVDASVKEASKGMGMTNFQILTKVELPLATPIIFAGIRTATVLNVGIATIATYIGAGGLGNFISRGIALNDINMILAGAIPAALLAIFFDLTFGILQKFITHIIKPVLFFSGVFIFIFIPILFFQTFDSHAFTLGCVPEFMERTDGYKNLVKDFKIKVKTKEMDSQLIFQALKNKEVDVIAGNSTEGRINAYKLVILKDDRNVFPLYYACPLIRGETLKKYPVLQNVFSKIEGKITNKKMSELNYQAEYNKVPIKKIASDFLTELGLKTNIQRSGHPDIIIGSKNFTEQFILAEIFALLIENNTNLNTEVKKGLAGTKICFDSLKKGEIDIYPEYTGTGLFVILKPGKDKNLSSIINDKNKLYNFVKNESKKYFDAEWLKPLGFNNTWALIMRKEDADKYNIKTISDLKWHLEKKV